MQQRKPKSRVRERLQRLRAVMTQEGVAALVVPSTDPHQSEYVGAHWQAREWLSGFTGSSGTLVVTRCQAGLWTDGRYFLQAARELRGSGIRLFKAREPSVPSVQMWIAATLPPRAVVALDGRLFSMEALREMREAFAATSLTVRASDDLVARIWEDRPPVEFTPAEDYPVRHAGLERAAKLTRIRQHLAEKQADALLLAGLDDIAWLLNLRGHDILHTPVVQAYALVERRRALLFIDRQALTPALGAALRRDHVECRPYTEVAAALGALKRGTRLELNPRRINQALAESLPTGVVIKECTPEITTELKSIKNPVELRHFRRAARLDGTALVRFMAWLEGRLATGAVVTELQAAEQLQAFRRATGSWREDSFETICAYGANAAMVHYRAGEGSAARLYCKGLLLVDSGGQYPGATMDTTRTIALGRMTRRARRDYTLVLKGLVALCRQRFPSGVTGTHLDTVARAALWMQGANYRHGSGHGVGSYLGVHEGPQSLSMAWSGALIKPGMVVTIEPGLYVEGQHGIRLENMAVVRSGGRSAHGAFMTFEILTRCPIDTRPILRELLTGDEIAWLDDYHALVWRTLASGLAGPERAWLKRRTARLGAAGV